MRTIVQQRRAERGMSLIEVMVVLAITSTVLLVAYNMIDEATRVSLFVESHNDLPVFGQAAVNGMQKDLVQARALFDGDASGVGLAYYAALNIPAAYPVMPGSQLPVMNATGIIIPDTATRYVGDVLFMTKQLDSTPVKLASGLTFMLDRYVFEIFYLTKRSSRGFGGQSFFLDIIQAKSGVYADYFQLTGLRDPTTGLAITAAQRTEINNALLAWKDPNTGLTVPINKAWDPSKPVTSAIYTITSTTYNVVAQPKIDLPTYGSLIAGLATGRISGKMDYTVGFRPTALTKFPVIDQVPKYAQVNSTLPLFPGGFEVLAVGPAGSRRVLTRMVLYSSYGAGRMDSDESLVITSVPRV